MNKKILAVLISSLLLVSMMTGCTKQEATNINNSNNTNKVNNTTSNINGLLIGEYTDIDKDGTWDNNNATQITLNGDKVSINGSGASYESNKLIIYSEGTYVLSGTLNDGQILILTTNKEKVQIVLNGVNITCSTNSVINVEQADKVFITLADGSINTITDSDNYTLTANEDEPNATIFSKDDLTLNGSGTLTINANYDLAIVSKDSLKITGGTYNITSVGHAIKGKDSVSILEGSFNITSGGDGIKSTNTTDTTKGYIIIDGGNYVINSQNDAIQAETILQISDGEFNLISGNGNENAPTHQDNMMMRGSFENQQTNDSSESMKGIKAGSDIILLGGNFTFDTCDDSIHSNANITIDNVNIEIVSGDDGIHADNILTINSGKINISKSYEGLEGSDIIINNGDITVTASDDGMNVAGGNDSSSINGRFGQNNFTDTENVTITINGGNILIDASGDGIDSNGFITVTGGTIAVYGPTNNGNGALDYGSSASITGGTFIASGSSGMAQNFTESTEQGSIMLNFTQMQQAGTNVAILDSNGSKILNYRSNKQFQNIVISSPLIKQGETYTIYTGGSDTGILTNGYYVGGTYMYGEKIIDITMDSLIVNINQNGTTINGGGMGMPGMGGNNPNKGNRK